MIIARIANGNRKNSSTFISDRKLGLKTVNINRIIMYTATLVAVAARKALTAEGAKV